ncbi:MAG: hypothetical protein KAQ99_07050 [Candidatus Aureabacteria bacterium]|nr:hypothetical protein [Candidatus Auribacterota bacterium]
MASEELIEFWIFIFGIFVCIFSVSIFILLIDRSRKAGPFHFLGYALMSAHAWQTGNMILDGEVGGLPTTTKEMQQVARQRVRAKQEERAHLSRPPDLTEEQLETTIQQLQQRKEALAKETEKVIP